MSLSNHAWLIGKVIRGKGRGKKLGFPTANLVLDKKSTRPKEGIYACYAKVGGKDKPRPAVLHAGPVPTFNEYEATVELHLLDYPYENLYGQIISFTCVRYLRKIEKFATINELKAAISQDCANAFLILN